MIKMVAKDLNWWIEKIRKNEIRPPFNVKNLFIRKLIKDQIKIEEILKNFNIHVNSFGVSGTSLFPLTIDIINREQMPGKWKWYGYDEALCVVYYGICPELENFVSLVLWPHESNNPEYVNVSRKAYRRIYELIIDDTYHQKVISLSGNYRLSLPNEIRPYRSEIKSIPKPKAVYDWLYVPYLKEVGETILSHKSPLNFTRIFLRNPNNELVTKYVNFKTTVGKFIWKRKSVAKFRLIYLTERKYYTPYEIGIHWTILNKFENIKKDDLVALLVGEVIDGKPQAILIDIEKIKPIDVFSHIMLFKLYEKFLENKRLFLMSWDQFEKFFGEHLKLTKNFCRGLDDSIGFDINYFFKFYLGYFIKRIDNDIFYVPFILNKVNLDDIKLFDKRLEEHKRNLFDNPLIFDEKGNIRRDIGELQRRYDLLRFLITMKLFVYKGVEI